MRGKMSKDFCRKKNKKPNIHKNNNSVRRKVKTLGKKKHICNKKDKEYLCKKTKKLNKMLHFEKKRTF